MHLPLRATLFAAALSATTAVLLAPMSPAVGDTCADAMRTEAGTCAKPVPTAPLTPAQKAEDAKIQKLFRRILAQLEAESRGTVRPDDPPAAPRSYLLPEMERMRIFKEGEGNGKKYWTCGPSASRNVIAALYKRRTGKYRDLTEQYFERIERTTRAGTSRSNIAAALTKHVPQFGRWRTFRPASKNHYLTHVMSRTLFGRSVIANVDTEPLDFWSGPNRGHFNFVYGYNAKTKKLRIGEEFDPTYLFGSTSPKFGHPYGKHTVSLTDAFRAINNSPIHGIVA